MIEACTKTSYLEQTMTLPWHSWVNRKTQSWLFNLPFSRKGKKKKPPPPHYVCTHFPSSPKQQTYFAEEPHWPLAPGFRNKIILPQISKIK